MSTQATKTLLRVGSERPNALLYTNGVGALIDLPSISVIVRGLDAWDHTRSQLPDLTEPRLLRNVRSLLGRQVSTLKAAPYLERPPGADILGEHSRVGVPVSPFPRWLRCSRCDYLAALSATGATGAFQFENSNPYRPDQARFVHEGCPRARGAKRRPGAVPARFVLACKHGHLDDFPYGEYVHRGDPCKKGVDGRLSFFDPGSATGSQIIVFCDCGERRAMAEALRHHRTLGSVALPLCRGRHPHLGSFDREGCGETVRAMVLGASNQWFGLLARALYIPDMSGELAELVDKVWSTLAADVQNRADLDPAVKFNPALKSAFGGRNLDDIWTEIEKRRNDVPEQAEDMTAREYVALADPTKAKAGDPDYEANAVPQIPRGWSSLLTGVVAVDRLRETRALIGFTRIDAPEWGDLEGVQRAPLVANDKPTWVPAAVTRGEGIFLHLNTSTLNAWEAVAADSKHMELLRISHRRWRTNRDMAPPHDDHWPGDRFLLLHTLSHLLIREIALECGYSSASIAERVYASTLDGRDEAGILLYTAASDSEGTLGGLVRLAQPAELGRILRAAFSNARRCSSDPLCGEHTPLDTEDSLHGAACHACVFASETTCQRGNRFLDRRLAVRLGADEPGLDLLHHLGGLPA